jgi:hypothetical protein
MVREEGSSSKKAVRGHVVIACMHAYLGAKLGGVSEMDPPN